MTEWSCKCGNLVLRCDSIKPGRPVSDPNFAERLLCTDASCVQNVSATKWSAYSKHKWLTMTRHNQFGTDELPTEVAEALPSFATSECTTYSCAVCQVRLYATLSVGQQEAIMIANETRRTATASQDASSKYFQHLTLFDIVLPDKVQPVDSATIADVNFNFDVARARAQIEAVTNSYVIQKTEEFRVALENSIRSAQRDKERLLAHIAQVFGDAAKLAVASDQANGKQLQRHSDVLEKSSGQSSTQVVVIDQLGSELENAVLAEMDIEGADSTKEVRTVEERERATITKVSESSNEEGAFNFTANSNEREMLELGEEAIERNARPMRTRGDDVSGLYSSSVPIGIPMREVNTKRRAGEITTVAEHEDEHDNAPIPQVRASKPTDVPKAAASSGEGAPMLFGASLRTMRAHTLTETDMETRHEQLQRTVEENDERTSEIGRKMAQSVRQADAFTLFERPQRSRQRAFTNDAMSTSTSTSTSTRTPALATSSKQPHIVTFNFK